MNILFIAHSKDNQSPQHRVKPIARELETRGHQCTTCYGSDRTIFNRPLMHIPLRSLTEILQEDYDVIVINRDGSPLARMIVSISNLIEVPIVFDLDDALYSKKDISGTSIPNPIYLFIDSLISKSDAVTVSNKKIYEYVEKRNKNCRLLHTPVDTTVFDSNLTPPRSYDEIVIGWMGMGRVHEDNLPLLFEPLKNIGKGYDIRLRILSALDSDKIYETFAPLEDIIEIDYGFDNWVSMEKIAREMATFDIAALPLNPNNDLMGGKSLIKVAEHLAMKIPVVASNYGAYGRAIEHSKTGLLAETTSDWCENFKLLIDSPVERERLADLGHEMVQKDYSVQSFTDEFESLLNTL